MLEAKSLYDYVVYGHLADSSVENNSDLKRLDKEQLKELLDEFACVEERFNEGNAEPNGPKGKKLAEQLRRKVAAEVLMLRKLESEVPKLTAMPIENDEVRRGETELYRDKVLKQLDRDRMQLRAMRRKGIMNDQERAALRRVEEEQLVNSFKELRRLAGEKEEGFRRDPAQLQQPRTKHEATKTAIWGVVNRLEQSIKDELDELKQFNLEETVTKSHTSTLSNLHPIEQIDKGVGDSAGIFDFRSVGVGDSLAVSEDASLSVKSEMAQSKEFGFSSLGILDLGAERAHPETTQTLAPKRVDDPIESVKSTLGTLTKAYGTPAVVGGALLAGFSLSAVGAFAWELLRRRTPKASYPRSHARQWSRDQGVTDNEFRGGHSENW